MAKHLPKDYVTYYIINSYNIYIMGHLKKKKLEDLEFGRFAYSLII